MSLSLPVSEQDHVQGAPDAPITLLQYGDFDCPYSGAAFPAVREARARYGDRLRYVFRVFPLSDIHRHALHAAQAAEAAGEQGLFWPMHDLLFENRKALRDSDIVRYAEQAGLDVDRFTRAMQDGQFLDKVRHSVESGKASGVHGTPTFFINGAYHDNHMGLWESDLLLEAIENAAS